MEKTRLCILMSAHSRFRNVSLSATLLLRVVAFVLFAGALRASPAQSAKSQDSHIPAAQAQAYIANALENQAEWPLKHLDNQSLSPTPPMGFSFWNSFGDNPGPNDELVRQTADALVETGLRDAGYKYFLAFDGGWWSAAVNPPRDSEGYPRIDKLRWPNGIQAVSDYIHQRGLKVGGYTDIGALGYCNPLEIGVRGHEQQDADQFARWGWDYIKVDDHGPGNFYAISKAIVNNSSGRPMVLSFSTPVTFPYEFAPRIANLWRVDYDITLDLGRGEWKRILREFDSSGRFWWAQAPGRWNDLDMLLIGAFGISDEEAKSHFSMWAVRGAPLLIGADVRAPHTSSSGPIPRLTLNDLDILKNSEIVAIDQDPLGASGKVIVRSTDGTREVDAKPLGSFASGEYAVLLLNRGDKPQDISVAWKSLGLLPTQASVRDLWKHADLGSISTEFTARSVPAHGVMMLRVKGDVDWSLPHEYEAESSYNEFYGLAHIRCLRNSDNEWPTGDAVVEGIGGDPENKLRFNRLVEDQDGAYRVTIQYGAADSRRARISLNDGAPVWVSFPATGADTSFKTAQVSLRLQAGENTLMIDNPTGLAPVIDKIVIAKEAASQ